MWYHMCNLKLRRHAIGIIRAAAQNRGDVMKKLTKSEALEIMSNTPWSFYYNAFSKNDNEKDAFYYKNHEVLDRIGSEIRTFNMFLGVEEDGSYDYTKTDKALETTLEGYPNRFIVPRIQLRPYASWGFLGKEWARKHPEELCVYYGGPKTKEEILARIDTPDYDRTGNDGYNKEGPGLFSGPSFSSKVWLDDCVEALKKFVTHLEQSKYANQILGYFIGGFGNCGENMWWGDWRNQGDIRRGDFGISNTKHFREFLLGKYGSIDGVRKAYGKENLTLDEIYEPDPQEYWSERGMNLRQLLLCDNQKMIDTFEFHCKVTRHALETFAKVCYDISGKPNGCFFGYLQDETVGYAGHLGIDELLKSPYIDFMSSPKAYHYCLAGDPGASQAPGQSISNKKLWVEENDSRSYHALKTDGDRAPKSLEDTITVFWREIYRALTMNFTFWWMDIGGAPGDDDWFSDEALVEMFTEQAKFFKKWRPIARKSIAEVVFVEDEASCGHMAQCSGVARNARYKLERELRLCGVPVDHLRVCDLLETDVSQYKFVVFCHAFVMPEKLWKEIKSKLNPAATILWNYAPAMIGENGFDFGNQTKVTGFKTRECGERALHKDQYKHIYWHCVHTCKQDYPLLEIVPSADDEIIQTTDDGHVITARKKHDGLTHILTVDFALRSALLTDFILAAGVKMLAKTHVAVLADNMLVGFFPRFDSEFTYDFDGKYRDAITGEIVEGKTKLSIPAKKFRIFEKVAPEN